MQKKIAIIQISEAGSPIASKLMRELGTSALLLSARPLGEVCCQRWHDFDAFVFIGALGICVRTIAPYIKDKHEDPAVVCVDSLGQHVISVLSGHVGGANDLARRVADILGAEPVITTQSDVAGLWPLDTLSSRFGWTVVGHASERDIAVRPLVGHASECDVMQQAVITFVNREPTALLIEAHDAGTEFLLNSLPEYVTVVNSLDEVDQRYQLLLFVSPRLQRSEALPTTLQFVPRVLTVGIGLAHQAGPAESILQEIETAIEQSGYLPQAILNYCTIDVKADEPVVKLLQERGATVRFFKAEELANVEVPTPSAIVAQHVGTPSVCEAAAILGSGPGHLVVPKQKGKLWTLAVAGSADVPSALWERGRLARPLGVRTSATAGFCREAPLPCRGGAGGGVSDFNLCGGELQTPPPTPPLEGRGERTQETSDSLEGRGERTQEADALADERGEQTPPHIEIVGAGPGDPDLISVRGRRMLERADLILYAGSLVPKALTDCHKPGAVVRSSADMTLEEQCALMKEHYNRGHFIVRLHTGDPCIFGAIQEQMAFFDREGMSYHITPGISSFLAAAAELRSQFTIPERTQTIILTRGEGRTPMPEREQLHLLARSQSTMCIFLSAAIVDDVQAQLLQHYPEDTPVAACYRLTWPDQKIYRGVLRDLARIVHDNHLTLTTMLVVGEAIDNRAGLSALYDKHFTHLYRQADPGNAVVPPAIIANVKPVFPCADEDVRAPSDEDVRTLRWQP